MICYVITLRYDVTLRLYLDLVKMRIEIDEVLLWKWASFDQVIESVLRDMCRRAYPIRSVDLGKDVTDQIAKHCQLKMPLVELKDVRV